MAEKKPGLVSLLYHCLYNEEVMTRVRSDMNGLIAEFRLQGTSAAPILRKMSGEGGAPVEATARELFACLKDDQVFLDMWDDFWADYQRNFPKIW